MLSLYFAFTIMIHVVFFVLSRLLSDAYTLPFCDYVLAIDVWLDHCPLSIVTIRSCCWITMPATTITTVRSFWLWLNPKP